MTISVITVNLNNAVGLERTIGSVSSQTLNDFEYIIIDGNSSDLSFDIIKKYEKSISSWICEADNGIFDAMNKGIHLAKGEYLIFLNSGDCFFSSEVLEEFISTNPTHDIISGDILIKHSNFNEELKKSPDFITAKYLINDYIPHSATFIKRSFLEKCGVYNENYKIISDWEFFLRAFLIYNASYFHLQECISVFQTDGISCKAENAEFIQNERDQILQTTLPYFYQDYLYFKQLEVEKENYRASTLKKSILFPKESIIINLYESFVKFKSKSFSTIRKIVHEKNCNFI